MSMSVKKLTKMALFVALLIVSAYLSIPLPHPIPPLTLLTMTGCLIALVMTPSETFLICLVYVLLGAVGLPVFANGEGGLGVILNYKGGYILSWPIAYTVLSALKGNKPHWLAYGLRSLVTIPIIYAMGVGGLMIILGLDLKTACMTGALPFIPGDIIKCLIAGFLACKIRRL